MKTILAWEKAGVNTYSIVHAVMPAILTHANQNSDEH